MHPDRNLRRTFRRWRLATVAALVACTPHKPVLLPQDSTAAVGDSADTAPAADSADTGVDSPWAQPCATYGLPTQTGNLLDPELDELSGVAVSRRDPNVLWVQEDHAGQAEIYAIDLFGETLLTLTLDDATNNDWEDIAIGPCGDDTCIFVGEIGNNDGVRTEFGVYVLREPDLSTIDGDSASVVPLWYGLDYPGDNQNAEALAVTADGLPVLLTKQLEEKYSDVYRYPALDLLEDVELTYLGTIETGAEDSEAGAALTAADLWPDDSRLIFRTYGNVFEIDLSDGLTAVGFSPITELDGADELHGEAVAYDPWRGGFWQIAEGEGSAIWYTGCAATD